MNLEKNTKEAENNKEGIITYIESTSYEDNTYWVCYKSGKEIGYEIMDNNQISEYKVGDKILIKNKLNINICSETLQELINNCVESDNEMWFVEWDEIEEDEVFKIQEEVIQLDKKYENLELMDHLAFGEDNATITVYGGVSTIFSF